MSLIAFACQQQNHWNPPSDKDPLSAAQDTARADEECWKDGAVTQCFLSSKTWVAGEREAATNVISRTVLL